MRDKIKEETFSKFLEEGGLMNKDLKVLLFDIETAPNLAFVWDKYEQNVISFERERYLLSFAYQWLGNDRVFVKALSDYPRYKKDPHNDRDLAWDLRQLFDEADVIIAHNGNKFDIKMANAAFAIHGFKPPSPYKQVDTLMVARSKFRFNSNKLDDLGKLLKVGEKVNTGGFGLWAKCLQGDMSAWKKMKKYNKHDVELLLKVYLILRPWMTNHPNLNLGHEVNKCPACQSNKLHSRGYGYTLTTKYQRLQCQSCGKWSRGNNQKTDVVIR